MNQTESEIQTIRELHDAVGDRNVIIASLQHRVVQLQAELTAAAAQANAAELALAKAVARITALKVGFDALQDRLAGRGLVAMIAGAFYAIVLILITALVLSSCGG